MFAALIVVLGQIGSLLLAYLLVSRALRRKEADVRRELTELFHSIVDAPDDTTPSALGVYGDHIASLFAARLVQQVEVRLRGSAGGTVRSDHIAEADRTVETLTGASPWLSVLTALLPKKIQRQLLTQPGLVGALTGAMRGKTDSGTNGGGTQFPLPM